ncbi:hypothetical protein NFHSH190041_06470 [Shewanella sp. NFH-SH190041]|nr:hypothetical protein NFHSH190041_06470 [Shewanella sp. NFH-SH190041]
MESPYCILCQPESVMSRRTLMGWVILLGIVLVGLFDYGLYRYGMTQQLPPGDNHRIATRYFESLRTDFISRFGCNGEDKGFCEVFDNSVQQNATVTDYRQALLAEVSHYLNRCLTQYQHQGQLSGQCRFLLHYQYTDRKDKSHPYTLEQAYRLSPEFHNTALGLDKTVTLIQQLTPHATADDASSH